MRSSRAFSRSVSLGSSFFDPSAAGGAATGSEGGANFVDGGTPFAACACAATVNRNRIPVTETNLSNANFITISFRSPSWLFLCESAIFTQFQDQPKNKAICQG